MNTIRVSIERKLTVSKTKVLVRMLAGTKACLETELAGVLCSAVILQWSLISLTFSSSATNKSREETSHWSRSVKILCSDWYYVRQLSYAIREPAQGTLKAPYKGHLLYGIRVASKHGNGDGVSNIMIPTLIDSFTLSLFPCIVYSHFYVMFL